MDNESYRIYFRCFNVDTNYYGGNMDGYTYLNEFREWTGWVAEILLCVYVIREFYYDAAKDEVKKQRRTKTTKKVSTLPSGEVITEENTESVENKGE